MYHDEIDRKILEILDQNGRTKFTDIAKSIQKTEGTVRNRIKRLQKKGIINGFRVVTFPENLGYEIQAIITFRLEPSYDNYIQIEDLPSKAGTSNSRLLSLYRASDQNLFMLEVLSKNLQDLNNFILHLKKFQGVSEVSKLLKEERIYEYIS
ncbi:MAG: Lrp/AsnC family transcriptional regulator [Candidatus Heimdallarchaeota archaeon]|nr:MAG: Lrp/AsnC family transcriptional regulator [Candidatus Heimdallarchaeota archaeon]